MLIMLMSFIEGERHMSKYKNTKIDKAYELEQRKHIEKCEKYKNEFINFIKERENENKKAIDK